MSWPVYGGSPRGDRYSELAQINRSNVEGLRPVWRFEAGTGDLQTSPIMIGDTLYTYASNHRVVALKPSTGEVRWAVALDSARPADASGGHGDSQPVRGLTYWESGKDLRIFVSVGSYLYALSAVSGKPLSDFGDAGRIDLQSSLGRDHNANAVAAVMTSPGIVYNDAIIVGFRTSETKPAAPGMIRAYDTRTGALRWTFNLIPRPGEFGHDTWPKNAWKNAGGANVWAGFALDSERGILFAPTGSAVDDFYGADRAGNNLYANSLVALNATSGQRLWHYQIIHHDLWDWDLPAPPVLLSVTRDGRTADVVAQVTKHGFVFVFDRVTGTPWFPIEERAVPSSDVPGEIASPTQPFPIKPAPFARNRLAATLVTNRTQEAHTVALKDLERFNNQGIFTPLTINRPTPVFPGFDGGAEWGGAAVDRATGVLYINSNDVVSLGTLIPIGATVAANEHGQRLYQSQCMICHGMNREGSLPDIPSLRGLTSKLPTSKLREVIVNGRGRMPSFRQLSQNNVESLIAYINDDDAVDTKYDGRSRRSVDVHDEADDAGYRLTGYKKWRDIDDYPAVKPPWGTLNAIDLNTGNYLWKVPLGEYPELSAQGIPITGTENYGGPIVTAGGLVFIGATIYDRKFRAFNSSTGQLLWSFELPYAGVATPITFMVKNRQYVVIACSGRRDHRGPQGAAYIAFALPPPISSGSSKE